MAVLYVVATPLGNLNDVTLRALEILKSVDLIVCEDTRMTKRLLDHYQIHKPTLSYHQHSDAVKVDRIIAELTSGHEVALVSDAGTPGISDPGNKLVAAAAQAKIKVVPIPGPSAVTAALSVAGLPTDRFIFLGFIPHKKGRQTLFASIAAAEQTVIFYESPHRIIKTLESLTEHLDATRPVVICRELTKIYEEIIRGSIDEVNEHFKQNEPRGEFVVIIGAK